MTNYKFMPFYVEAFRVDTLHLDWKARAAYRALLDAYWSRGYGLTDDDKELSNLIGMNAREWGQVRDKVMAFFTLRDGLLIQKRMEQEITEAKLRTEAAQAKASKRWGSSDATVLPQHKASNALPMQATATATAIEELRMNAVQKPASAASAPPPKKARFSKPSLEEITAYCTERGNSVDPQHWLDHYTSNGWKVGRNPMTDWRATVRTWERNDVRRAGSGGVDARTVAEIFGGAS